MAAHAGGNTLHIPKDNLVFRGIILKVETKIQDNCKSELFIIVSKYNDPNVYTIHPLHGGSGVYDQPMTIV